MSIRHRTVSIIPMRNEKVIRILWNLRFRIQERSRLLSGRVGDPRLVTSTSWTARMLDTAMGRHRDK